jgi:hypothetical protein
MVRARTASRGGVALAIASLLVALGIACVLAAALARAVVGSPRFSVGAPVADIPPAYVAAYRSAATRFGLAAEGWSYLAAIGKVESNHGRSTASGVHSGQNFHGCCAGPMQIHNGFGSGGATWGVYKTDGDGDGRLDIYDPDDAIATAARYLRSSGAPTDWRSAVFSYNHAGWYVEDVLRRAAAYRLAATSPPSLPTPEPVGGSTWLVDVPGFPGERCDGRIVAEIVALVRAYGLHVHDCFGGAPHATNGEHPLGLALDVAPTDGDWSRTERLARAAGWSPACASEGCPDRGPFRLVLYNGFPGHGDPHHSRRPHLHLSWNHGATVPFSRAPWVRRVLLTSTAGAG